MIRHLVMFNALATATDDQVAAVFAAARDMPSRIPGVRNLAVSESFEVVQPPRFRYALTMEFADEEALRTYISHPVHQQFRELYYAIRDDFMVLTLREIAASR